MIKKIKQHDLRLLAHPQIMKGIERYNPFAKKMEDYSPKLLHLSKGYI